MRRWARLGVAPGAEAMSGADGVFDVVAAYFSVLSEPIRLRIMHAICEEEKSVSKIVAELGANQTSISRHLNLMHRSGVLARRKEGSQVYYRAADAAMVEVCRSVCDRIASRMDESTPLRHELRRLMPRRARPRVRGR